MSNRLERGESRPALDRLKQDAGQPRSDAVLGWKLDRWSHSEADYIHSIQELVSLGVRFLAAFADWSAI